MFSYRFLSLSLVGLHLELQLVNQILQPGNIFLVLLSLKGTIWNLLFNYEDSMLL